MNYDETLTARREAATARNAAWRAAREYSQSRPFKKGDKVFIVRVSLLDTGAHVSGQEVELQSLGARQGTAISVADGQFTQVRVYREFDLLVATREEVESIAAKVGPLAHREHLLGSLHCTLSNYPNLHAQYRPKADAEIARLEALLAAGPKYTVAFQ